MHSCFGVPQMKYTLIAIITVGGLIASAVVLILGLLGAEWFTKKEQARAIDRIENLGGAAHPLVGGDRYPECVGIFRTCSVDFNGTKIGDDDLKVLDDLQASVG